MPLIRIDRYTCIYMVISKVIVELASTLPTKVEDDSGLKQHIKDIFQLSCVHVKICMNLASSRTTWCFSFHVPLTMLEV